ncbi:MAG: hypothetical protein ACKOBW_03740 [Planctomycetota bacterium]
MERTSFDLETNEPLITPLEPVAGSLDSLAGASAGDLMSAEKLPAWEQVDVGRFRPRRIRGSYLGRELG